MSRILLLVELKGGNDGLNTVIPYADPRYRQLRPAIGVARERVLQLDEHVGLHEKLEPFMEAWKARDLAIVQGVGYANPNRSHFRSIEIWDTASSSSQTLSEGWIARALEHAKPTSSATSAPRTMTASARASRSARRSRASSSAPGALDIGGGCCADSLI